MEKRKLAKIAMLTAAMVAGADSISVNQVNAQSYWNKWLWQSLEVSCSVTVTYGGGPVPYSYAETFPGKKIKCIDGPTLCVPTICH